MYGEKLELITRQCCVCGKHVAMRVDMDDLARHLGGTFVQDSFVRRDGTPYLSDSERELFPACSGVCADCYSLLCLSDRLAYN